MTTKPTSPRPDHHGGWRRAALLATVALLLAAPGVTPAAEDNAAGSMLEPLAGPGGTVELEWERLPDGSGGTMRTKSTAEGGFSRLEIVGIVTLRSPRINLDAHYLLYDAENQKLVARGNVELDQTGVQATCEELNYDLATEHIELTGNPIVSQSSEERSARFAGMETFLLLPKEGTEEKEIRLVGGTEITCDIAPAEPAAGTPATIPAPDATPAADTGLGVLGDTLRIVTRSGRTAPPSVLVATSAENEMNTFEARGAVTLESTSLNLRADELYYDGPGQQIEAIYNVYLRQEGIEADCQKLEYDLAKDRIVLTGNPIIRKDEGNQIMRISEIVSFIINRYPDGSSDTEIVPGVGSRGRTEFIPKDAAATPTPVPTDDEREINLDDPDALRNLGL